MCRRNAAEGAKDKVKDAQGWRGGNNEAKGFRDALNENLGYIHLIKIRAKQTSGLSATVKMTPNISKYGQETLKANGNAVLHTGYTHHPKKSIPLLQDDIH